MPDHTWEDDPTCDGAPLPAATPVRAAYGSVVNIRSIPSRSVTRIEIEMPIEAHVEATRVLFGRDVFVLPAAVQAQDASTLPYGMTACGEPARSQAAGPAPGRAAGATSAARPSAPATRQAFAAVTSVASAASADLASRSTTRSTSRSENAAPNPGTRPQPLDILVWLGARCREPRFQAWLGASGEEQAAAMVRQRCGVTTRSDIPVLKQARSDFFEHIYHPYRNAVRRQIQEHDQPRP